MKSSYWEFAQSKHSKARSVDGSCFWHFSLGEVDFHAENQRGTFFQKLGEKIAFIKWHCTAYLDLYIKPFWCAWIPHNWLYVYLFSFCLFLHFCENLMKKYVEFLFLIPAICSKKLEQRHIYCYVTCVSLMFPRLKLLVSLWWPDGVLHVYAFSKGERCGLQQNSPVHTLNYEATLLKWTRAGIVLLKNTFERWCWPDGSICLVKFKSLPSQVRHIGTDKTPD